MNVQRIGTALAGTVLAGLGGLAATVAPAAAAPGSGSAPATPSSITQSMHGPAYWQGYRDGRRDGWAAAREDCNSPMSLSLSNRPYNSNREYVRGYEYGFRRGFHEGYRWYC